MALLTIDIFTHAGSDTVCIVPFITIIIIIYKCTSFVLKHLI